MTVDAILKIPDALFLMPLFKLRPAVFVATETGIGDKGVRMALLAPCITAASVIQRERMLLKTGWRPGLYRVTGAAVGAELGAMHIGFIVAGRAVRR